MQTGALLRFANRYASNNIREALDQLFLSPSLQYQELENDGISQGMLNAVDALCFGNFEQAILALNQFDDLCQNTADIDEAWLRFRTRLKLDAHMLLLLNISDADFETYLQTPRFQTLHPFLIHLIVCERREIELSEEEAAQALASMPSDIRPLLSDLMKYSQRWMQFKRERRGVFDQLKELHQRSSRPKLTRTFYPLVYSSHPLSPEQISLKIEACYAEGRIPVIFVEALALQWHLALQPASGNEAIFLFKDVASLCHAIAIDGLFEQLLQECHYIYLLDHYPKKQMPLPFDAQLSWIAAGINVQVAKYQNDIIKLLEVCGRDDSAAAILYQLGKNIAYFSDGEKLGKARILALRELKRDQELQDFYKSPEALTVPYPSLDQLLSNTLSDIEAPKKISRFPHSKIKICHIVPQIVDGNHAPSRILRTIIEKHDMAKFSPSIAVTERLHFRPLEYPHNLINHSVSSWVRGRRDIAYFNSIGVPVDIDTPEKTFFQTGKWVGSLLESNEIDIAVFHGPDPINTVASLLTGCRRKILIEHGVAPAAGSYDLVVCSTEEDASDRRKDSMQAIALPFNVDITAQWENSPYPRSFFGTPAGALHMTTISNHLEVRLSNEMRAAIGKILKMNPHVYYLPIGPIQKADTLFQDFDRMGVIRQFWPMGRVPVPSQYARSMDLYLNEFPLGGCLGVLDAMAAGCPIVTMYYPNAPSAWKYGGSYLGIEKAVLSGKWEDYAALAHRLLNDESMRKQWSEHSLMRYRSHSDPVKYVRAIETAALDNF